MWTDSETLQALFNLDRFVRLMAIAPNIDEVLGAVREYLVSWPRERIDRLHAAAKGWTPFDDCLRPYPVSGVKDVRQMCGSVRIRCRDLEASGTNIPVELRELDLFFFFAIESLEVHEGQCRRVPLALEQATYRAHVLPLARGRSYEQRT